MTKQGSTKIVNFMTTGAGKFVLGRGNAYQIVKMHDLFNISSSLLQGMDKTN